MRFPLRFALFPLLCCLSAWGCGGSGGGVRGTVFPPDQSRRVTISQGVWGNVWLWQGDFMPANPSGTITPVRRSVYVHELTARSQTVPSPDKDSRFFEAVQTPLVARVESDSRGFFQVELPPGRYSLFVGENGRLYANGSDHIRPVQVSAGTVTKAQIDINYQATY